MKNMTLIGKQRVFGWPVVNMKSRFLSKSSMTSNVSIATCSGTNGESFCFLVTEVWLFVGKMKQFVLFRTEIILNTSTFCESMKVFGKSIDLPRQVFTNNSEI